MFLAIYTEKNLIFFSFNLIINFLLLGVYLYTTTRKLIIKTKTEIQLFRLLKAILEAIKISPYVADTRFNSFSPVRLSNKAEFFTNSENYWESLYYDLEKSEREILIRGWWVCPEIYLKRPIEDYPDSRFDYVLERAAKR